MKFLIIQDLFCLFDALCFETISKYLFIYTYTCQILHRYWVFTFFMEYSFLFSLFLFFFSIFISEMEKKTKILEANISDLDSQINSEEEKASALRRRAKSSTGEDQQKELLDHLKDKVRE